MEDIRKGVCPLCRHNKIIQSHPADAVMGSSFPLALVKEKFWSMSTGPRGVLYVCTCQRCGFSQWFAVEPEKVPIAEGAGTSLIVGPESEGPYR